MTEPHNLCPQPVENVDVASTHQPGHMAHADLMKALEAERHNGAWWSEPDATYHRARDQRDAAWRLAELSTAVGDHLQIVEEIA